MGLIDCTQNLSNKRKMIRKQLITILHSSFDCRLPLVIKILNIFFKVFLN